MYGGGSLRFSFMNYPQCYKHSLHPHTINTSPYELTRFSVDTQQVAVHHIIQDSNSLHSV